MASAPMTASSMKSATTMGNTAMKPTAGLRNSAMETSLHISASKMSPTEIVVKVSMVVVVVRFDDNDIRPRNTRV